MLCSQIIHLRKIFNNSLPCIIHFFSQKPSLYLTHKSCVRNHIEKLPRFCINNISVNYCTGNNSKYNTLSSLRCARNTLHTHMFTSFAINNLLWLLWYRLVVEHPSVVLHNGWWCQILHVVLHYFLLTNYAWMLAEGFYLHTLLVFAFTSEDTLVRWSWTLAWSTPLVVISLYTSLVLLIITFSCRCWINESPFTEVLVVPVCMSMALNLVFLCNIVRVLWVKLQAGPSHLSNSTPSRTLLQAFRATLLLLPLLGLHYLLTPFRPPKQHPWEPFYEVVSATTSSFQGLCVATLFCFLNGEPKSRDGGNSCFSEQGQTRTQQQRSRYVRLATVYYLHVARAT
ncbi:calcitonin gene-related peptide type 1 receptor [Aphis craccivora]|uniref:Calcitonin gene-related peptide type 1 receptor n=1 Tax=Aphis craccivora TaxID=307492 RepID=A0A6G0ZLS8_APHCR|nr:calcitonin gene-related peptide type 1 receptor [Aphis craccivora]